MRRIFIAGACLTLLGGCAVPSINLGTNEPIQVDINMRLDVYQHDAGGTKPSTTAKPAATPAPQPETDPATRRKNRQADIQVFKNSRLVGEGRRGLIVILEEVDGDYGDYIRRTVERENADRMEEMKQIAEKEKKSLPDVQDEQARLWVNRSFTGEWIETKQPDGTYKWVQKAG